MSSPRSLLAFVVVISLLLAKYDFVWRNIVHMDFGEVMGQLISLASLGACENITFPCGRLIMLFGCLSYMYFDEN